MLKIEVGKRYVTRDGRVTQPITKSKEQWGERYPYSVTIGNFSYDITKSGKQVLNNENDLDLVKEYVEEKVFKLEVGKRYISRDGEWVSGPVEWYNNNFAVFNFKTKVYNIKTGEECTDQNYRWQNNYWNYTEKGQYSIHNENPYDLVSIYEEKPKLTLPLQVGKKYVLANGKIVRCIRENKYTDSVLKFAKIGEKFGLWYYVETGKNNINDKNQHIVADYVEFSTKVEIPKPKKKKPIKYTNLKFYEAWELAKETKKRYRFKGQDWLEFPNVSVTRELFEKEEWEVENG